MTKLLYLDDSYLQETTATVVSVEKKNKITEIILDQTIFYPIGGGQPSDKGTIAGPNGTAHVKHVRMVNDSVVHESTLEGNIIPGERVKLHIDWSLRLKHMRSHSAGHIVHEAVVKLHPELIPIKGEHGNDPYIEYKGSISSDEAIRIEQETDAIVESDGEITSQFVSYDELISQVSYVPAHLPKHKPLRIIQIEGFPPIPDGGTQLKKTGEAGKIRIESIINSNGTVQVHYTILEEPQNHEARIPDITSGQLTGLLIELQQEAKKTIRSSMLEKDVLRNDLLGNKSEFSRLSKLLSEFPKEERGRVGMLLNQVKKSIAEEIENYHVTPSEPQAKIDVTLPGHRPYVGHFHPTTIVIKEMNDIFKNMGFSVYDGPEIETDEYNYDRLNLPPDHPARDLQDSLFIQQPNILLRTQTSSIEAHILEECVPPYRFVIPGKVYRYENVSASNNSMFFQYQGIAVGAGITMAELKGTLNSFVKQFFGEERETRFRCKYYPEVEPGVGVDISCAFCNKKGCVVCKWRGWIEMLGAGMIHPNMLRRVGLNPNEVTGFAWGMGLDRIVMQRYGISDIRSLYNGDIGYKE